MEEFKQSKSSDDNRGMECIAPYTTENQKTTDYDFVQQRIPNCIYDKNIVSLRDGSSDAAQLQWCKDNRVFRHDPAIYNLYAVHG